VRAKKLKNSTRFVLAALDTLPFLVAYLVALGIKCPRWSLLQAAKVREFSWKSIGDPSNFENTLERDKVPFSAA